MALVSKMAGLLHVELQLVYFLSAIAERSRRIYAPISATVLYVNFVFLLPCVTALTDEECWEAGSGFSRSECCYQVDAPCWSEYFTPEECCKPVTIATGPRAFAGFGGADGTFEKVLTVMHLKYRNFLIWTATASPRASNYVLIQQHWLLERLRAMRNITIDVPGKLPHMIGSAYYFFLVYFVALEAMRPWLSARSYKCILRRETEVWELWTDVFRLSFGLSDFCRCMEGGDAYSQFNGQLRKAGVGKPTFGKTMLNATFQEHHILRSQKCRELPDDQFAPENSIGLLFSTGCVSGDLGIALLLAQGCILEHQITKALYVFDTMMHLAPLGYECHDEDFWQFSVRDVLQQYGKMVWEITKRDPGYTALEYPFLRRLVWSARQPDSHSARPWHRICGPHEVVGPLMISSSASISSSVIDTHVVGPCCTEIGRFWLRLHSLPVDSIDYETLVIIPITFPWWANPYHHFHWWVPALWHFRIVLQLRPDSTIIGLTFPDKDADWGKSVTANPTTLERSEPVEWSFLQGTWPRTKPEDMKPWSPQGLHRDILLLLSTQPTRTLSDLAGLRFNKVIIGVPPIRFHVQAPRPWCAQIAAVRKFIQGTRNYRALEIADKTRLKRGLRQLTILQRPIEKGRTIENVEQVVTRFREKFHEQVDVRVVHGFQHGTSWTEQFRVMATTDILFAAHGGVLGWAWALRNDGALIELRSPETPVWVPCSGQWDVDVKEMFGGMARLAGVHHICVRLQTGEQTARALSIGVDGPDMLEWDREASMELDLQTADRLLTAALLLMNTQHSIPCY